MSDHGLHLRETEVKQRRAWLVLESVTADRLHIRETEVKQRRARLVPGWATADCTSEKLKLSNIEPGFQMGDPRTAHVKPG